MGPGEARDLMFAGAGILWGSVTFFRGMQIWRKKQAPFPPIVVVAAALAISCLGYLVHRL
jgi:hypothetical protein